MGRLIILALFLRACSAPEPGHPPASHLTLRSWSASILTSGGYGGGGKGAVVIGPDAPCMQQLSAQKRAEIESAVAAARPETWKPFYRPDIEHMSDQFYYSFTFKIERSDGSGGNYSVHWQSETEDALPPDLRRLNDALWAAHPECDVAVTTPSRA
jgi:hypothetical protein